MEMKMAMEALRKELLFPEIVDWLNITVLPSEEAVREQLEQIANPVQMAREPDLQVHVGDLDVWLYLAINELSPNDPYVIQQAGSGKKIIVIVNASHPYVKQMSGEQFQYHLRECAYDALSEARAERLRSKIDPDTVKLIKDGLLRVPFLIEQHEADSADAETEDDSDAATSS